MNQSTNYKFNLPSDDDFYDINQQNENWNKADENLKNLEDKKVDATGGDTAETIVSNFETSAESFPVPAAEEKAKTGWGKVKKFGEDFKAWMTGVCLLGHIVNNCVTNNPNLPLSAAQGKALMDLYTVLNTKLFYNKEVYGLNIPQNAGNTGRAVIWRNASPSDNYGTMIGDYNNQINTELKLLNGEVWLIRTNADKTKTEKLIAKL